MFFFLLVNSIKIYIYINVKTPNSSHLLQAKLYIFVSWVKELGVQLNNNNVHVLSFFR